MKLCVSVVDSQKLFCIKKQSLKLVLKLSEIKTWLFLKSFTFKIIKFTFSLLRLYLILIRLIWRCNITQKIFPKLIENIFHVVKYFCCINFLNFIIDTNWINLYEFNIYPLFINGIINNKYTRIIITCNLSTFVRIKFTEYHSFFQGKYWFLWCDKLYMFIY